MRSFSYICSICACLVLSVSSSSWCLGRAAVYDCGIPWTFFLPFFTKFARASSNLSDFNCRNKALTAKLLRQGYRFLTLRMAFSKFYRRHSALIEKYSVSLKTFLQQGISEPEFYGDLMYEFRTVVGKCNCSELFRKLINRYKRMRQTACLVINIIIVDGYAYRTSLIDDDGSGLRLNDGLFVKF